jgi:hypothetical protein
MADFQKVKNAVGSSDSLVDFLLSLWILVFNEVIFNEVMNHTFLSSLSVWGLFTKWFK